MDLGQVIKQLEATQKSLTTILTALRQVSRLDEERTKNVFALQSLLAKLDAAMNALPPDAKERELLTEWLNDHRGKLQASEQEIKERFGVELEKSLRDMGVVLSGHYPELRAGLFTIVLNFDKKQATIWYGPKQELLHRCRSSVADVASSLERVRKGIGSSLEPEALLGKIEHAYRAMAREEGYRAPIIEVLAELAILLQGPSFLENPVRENYRSYGRADFSYDLFRATHSGDAVLLGKRVSLTVATFQLTKNRRNFLWVPTDRDGTGTMYSHLEVKEE
jgi:hypothetical protein